MKGRLDGSGLEDQGIFSEKHLTKSEEFLPLTLSNQQRSLMKALEARDRDLSIMYRGGLVVFADTNNPDRFSLCAHAMREMMEKLPEYLNVSVHAHKESLKSKVHVLADAWSAARDSSTLGEPRVTSDGNIDGRLATFLRKVAEFFQWFAEHHPRRRKEVHNVLKLMDGSGRTLPQPLAELNVKTWNEIRDFFVNVAHHRRDTTAQEFSDWIDALERFLLDRLLPRTFEDFAEIDALLRGGSNANP